jgi:hypothetical protein
VKSDLERLREIHVLALLIQKKCYDGSILLRLVNPGAARTLHHIAMTDIQEIVALSAEVKP